MRNTTAGSKPGSRSGIVIAHSGNVITHSGIVIARFGTPRSAITINRNG
ncbi:hypothetical protein [Trinickia soli]